MERVSLTKHRTSSRADFSCSLSSSYIQTSSCFYPTPPNLPSSPSLYLFLLHPTYPACSNLWQMMVGWHQNGATGRETVYTPHGSDKQRETPLDFLLCCSSVPVADVQILCMFWGAKSKLLTVNGINLPL